MRFTRKILIAVATGLALAGAAFAAERATQKTMLVALPDGSVEHIRYIGDTPPRVTFVAQPAPADMFAAAFGPNSAFAEMQRVSAAMQARSEAMLRQAAMLSAQAPAAADGKGVTLVDAAGQPVGVMHYSYASSSTDANGCTQTISYNSDGQASQPRVVRTASDGCSAAVKAGVSQAAAPAAKPVPVVTPVSAPKPAPKAVPTHSI